MSHQVYIAEVGANKVSEGMCCQMKLSILQPVMYFIQHTSQLAKYPAVRQAQCGSHFLVFRSRVPTFLYVPAGLPYLVAEQETVVAVRKIEIHKSICGTEIIISAYLFNHQMQYF